MAKNKIELSFEQKQKKGYSKSVGDYERAALRVVCEKLNITNEEIEGEFNKENV